jgi:hypothetical protein
MARTGRAAALAAALLSIPACASADPSLRDADADLVAKASRLVHEAKPGAAAAALRDTASAAEGDGEADRAEDQLAEGDAAGALETARRALERLPPREQAERLRDIRLRARRAYLRDAVVRGEASSAERAAEGGNLEVRVTLRNLAPVPLEVPPARGGMSPTLVLLRVTRTAFDVYGNARTESWEESHPLPEGRAATKGGIGTTVSVDTSRFRETVPHGFVRYEFGGSILPSGTRVGDLVLHDRIPVDPAATLAFPQRGWEDVAAEPGPHLDRGLRAGNPVRVLVAAACLPAAEREGAGLRMARALRDGAAPAMEGALRAALRYLGEDPGADRWAVEVWEARASTARFVEEER